MVIQVSRNKRRLLWDYASYYMAIQRSAKLADMAR
jgi:hypothetical protein